MTEGRTQSAHHSGIVAVGGTSSPDLPYVCVQWVWPRLGQITGTWHWCSSSSSIMSWWGHAAAAVLDSKERKRMRATLIGTVA